MEEIVRYSSFAQIEGADDGDDEVDRCFFVVTTKKTGGQEGNNEIDRKRAFVDPRVTLREQTAQVTELAQNSPKLFVPRSFLFSSSQARQ